MKLAAPFALCVLFATAAGLTPAQQTSSASTQPQFTDPANLRGERVKPRDGRELPIDTGASGLAQLLRKLNTRASILNIVAHPDDEDGGMLTFYARGLGARVTDLSLTRGEGGQNAMTGDFEDALGLLRTQELLANDRYTGVDQLFGTEVDFGFSKTKSEAFAKWTHDRVLYDAVRAIRLVRPLVITATFIGGVTDGHGQHQVSGQIAQEAFLAAADPKVFPDMLAEGILPWQALRVYARVPFADINAKGVFDYATGQYVAPHFVNYVTGKVSITKPPTDVIVPEGTPDPLFTAAAANPSDLPLDAPIAPLSYAQFSRIGLGLQRSQISKNMRLPTSGDYDSGYTLYGSVLCNDSATTHSPSTSPQNCHPEQAPRAEGPATKSGTPRSTVASSPADLTTHPNFFTGIDTSLNGILSLDKDAPLSDAAWERFTQSMAEAQKTFDPKHPEMIAPLLADALGNADLEINLVLKNEPPSIARADLLHELRLKRVQLNDALTLSLGLTLDANLPHADLIALSDIHVTTTLTQESPAPRTDIRESISNSNGDGLGDGYSSPGGPAVKRGAPLTRDLAVGAPYTDHITQPYFYRDNIEQSVYKLRDPQLRNAPESLPAITILADVPFQDVHINLSRMAHDGPQPATIIPPVSISSRPTATVVPLTQTQAELTANLGTISSTSANVNVQSPKGWAIEAQLSPDLPAHNSSIHFFLHPITSFTTPQLFHVTAETPDHHTYTEGYRPIGYGDLPRTNYYTPAATRIVPVDLQLPAHHNIAYLPGTGDAVPEALASINLTPTILTVADLTPDHLKQFDTVILGVRTYNAHPDLHGAPTRALLDYARNGGNVVVQYQTPEFTAADAPYPLSLGSNEKVVDETAPVQLLTPTDKLLTTPNRITPADFNNWIEERGHGFLSTWDPRYTALTETHDPGVPAENIAAQLPQRGGLITAAVGKGRWTYCAFALYRQLPEAVPGAFRLFMNLLNP